jgi:hypothetical protein
MVRIFVIAAIVALQTAPASAALFCLAPSLETDAKKPIQDVESLEIYFDEGNVARSWSAPFHRVDSNPGAAGHVQNSYSIGETAAIGATIDFSGEPASVESVAVVPIDRLMTSTGPNKDETDFMADAVPGIACYSVTVKHIMQQ